MRVALFIVFICISGYSFAEAQDKFLQCMEGLKHDSRFSSIANHVALEGQGAASPGMLSDGTRPDERQKHAITEWIDARSECVNSGPSPVVVNLHMAFVGVVLGLYNGQLTFGEFNKEWRVLFNKGSNH